MIGIRKACALALIVPLGMVTAACGGGSSSGGQAGGDTLTIGESVAPDTLDPQASSLADSRYTWELSYQCLLAAKPDGSVGPALAKSYTVSPDGLTYEFTLPDDATFHSGAKVTSEDVVYTFTRLKKSGIPYAVARFPGLKSVTAKSPTVVDFVLDKPDTSFLLNMADPTVVACAILSKKTGTSKNLASVMDGTGPYRQVTYVPNQSLTLERFDGYRSTPAKIKNLKVLYVKDQSTARANLLSGKVDLMFPDVSSVNAMKNNKKVTVSEIVSARSVGLNINNVRGPLAKLDVRKAVAAAIDRDALVATAYQGAAVSSGYVPTVYPWAPKLGDLANHKTDQAEAKRLLAAAGYPNGVSLELMYIAGNSPAADRIVSTLQSQLGEVGIKVKLVPLEATPWTDKMAVADYELSWNIYSYYADPLQYVVPRDGRQAPTPESLATLIGQVRKMPVDKYNAGVADIAKMEAELVYPDVKLLTEKSFVASRSGVNDVKVPFTLNRVFLTDVTFGG